VISVLEAASREVTFEELCEALRVGIEETFSIQLTSAAKLTSIF
jgi:hypothetical protein